MSIEIRQLQQTDLADAERVRRESFSAYMGLPDPALFNPGGTSSGRYHTDPQGGFGAFENDTLVGMIYAMHWGSFGYFGPLAVQPRYWEQGIAQQLLGVTMDFFTARKISQSGLFTYPNSSKHINLYQKFNYWPRALTAIMFKSPTAAKAAVQTFSQITKDEQATALKQIETVTGSVYGGLSLTKEVDSVYHHQLGDTVILYDKDTICGFAICHFGAGSEADRNSLFIKFAAVRDSVKSATQFAELLTQCQALALSHNLEKISAGINTARLPAYQSMLSNGFKIAFLGVAMLRPPDEAFNRPDCFVIDDWR